MARLFAGSEVLSPYRDRRFPGTQDEFEEALQASTTVYVGNLSFYTTEEQIYDLFSRCGEIKKIIMGLDKNSKTPCGFCFVMYYTREDTEDAVKYVSGTMLDERPIRVDFDWGFQDGRQWGRGRSGGQVRDEYRTDYDPGRGGYGKIVQRELESRRQLVDYAGNLGTYYNSSGAHDDHRSSHRSSRGRKRHRGDDDYRSDRYRESNRESRPEKNPRFRERHDSDEEESSKR
ncbi:hypothetical protein KP509_26G018400 [Ceratopteris richardii]|uniref:Nuclear cap-binding protein subunit 2 n=1 Tax=Ceratopteris richardii TaxID=49495 RepID=A0A8T2RK33_CERRI|nr:hypothetical protein KP509_26G018400 [Ceratopteris richardii]